MMQPLTIGSVVVERPVLLAPMAGVTDVPFRTQAHAFGAPYTVSEMVACDQLSTARPDMVRRAAGGDRLSPLVIQLAGREAHWMARGAQVAEDAGADVVDINMGCPCKRVTNGLSGSALMQDPDAALRLIEATVAATRLPVTLKMRLGWDLQTANAPAIAKRAQSAGVRMIVVHGRTRNQFYGGAADWRAIRATVEAVTIPVIANGDIKTAADARTALAQSGAAGVMIGRSANGAPWAPAALARALASETAEAKAPSARVVRESLIALYEHSLSFYGMDLGKRIARKHIAWTLDAAAGLSLERRKALRADLCRMEDPQMVRRSLAHLDLESWGLAA
jgi:nifR3 family TIM-barrel protein